MEMTKYQREVQRTLLNLRERGIYTIYDFVYFTFKDLINEQIESGMSAMEISKFYGMNPNGLFVMLKRYNINTKGKSGPK